MEQKIKMGLIGATHPHSRFHLRTMELMDEVESVLVYDADEEALSELQKDMGSKIEKTYTDLEKMLERDDVFAVFSVMKNDENVDTIIKAAEAGKHIMSEKPAAVNSTEMKRAIEVVEKAGVALSLCYQNRFNPISLKIKQLVADGVLGRPLTFEAKMVTSQVKFRNPGLWLFDKKQSGGGILSWLGCHYIDGLRFWLQDEVVSVSAMVGTLGGEAIDVEDAACMTMKFSKGTIGTFHAGYLLPISEGGYSGATYDTYIAIKGSHGRLSWTPTAKGNPTLFVESATGVWSSAPQRKFSYTFARSEAYGGVYGLEFIRAFVKSALTGEEPPNTGYDALRVLEIIEAAYESSETGRRVDITSL